MTSLPARRRHPVATLAVLLLALVGTGGLYAALAPQGQADASVAGVQAQTPIETGRELYLANCSTCHGITAEGGSNGPSLVGVGAASVDFQVGTGRMPAARSAQPQVPQVEVSFTEEQIAAMAAYIGSLGPGPEIPTEEQYSTDDLTDEEIARGGELFRTNCSMCHNATGAGGALTGGKYAPALAGVAPKYIYEAMLTGPQQMPIFAETVPPEEKRQIIGYLEQLEEQPAYGGLGLGNLGPVTEGLLVWVVGIGGLIGVAVWLGAKSS